MNDCFFYTLKPGDTFTLESDSTFIWFKTRPIRTGANLEHKANAKHGTIRTYIVPDSKVYWITLLQKPNYPVIKGSGASSSAIDADSAGYPTDYI